MKIWQALVLGIIQGLSEFLPISSSGHLLLFEKFIGNLQSEQMLLFNITVHVGSLVAVLIALKDKWLPLLKKPLCKTNGYIVLACIPTALMAILFKVLAPSLIDGKLLGAGFVMTACLLYASDNFAKDKNIYLFEPAIFEKSTTALMHASNKNSHQQSGIFKRTAMQQDKSNNTRKMTKSALYNIKTSVLTGIMQGIAVLPGISRSGATISTLRLCGVKKEEATTFSFMLSIPIIIGSALYESLPLITQKTTLSISPAVLLVGMISAFISGFASIKFFLKIVKNRSMSIFIVYTLLMGIAVSILPIWL